jgi:hypothetical protein
MLNTEISQTTILMACEQFAIDNAKETIKAVSLRANESPPPQAVFSPPYHGPRNIPIAVIIPKGNSFTHFPIVRTGKYAIFIGSGTPDVTVTRFYYPGINQNTCTGTPIVIDDIDTTKINKNCASFKAGYVSASKIIFTRDDPQPIAIGFDNTGDQSIIEYIVTLCDDH